MEGIETIKCPRCGNLFPKLRKEKYGYNFCVDCSTVVPKAGIVTVNGEKDHTWNDLLIIDQDVAIKIAEKEAEFFGIKNDTLEILDLDVDEMAVSRSIDEAVKFLTGEEDLGEVLENIEDQNLEDEECLL